MIVIPNARMAAEFMADRLQLQPTYNCQGALFARSNRLGEQITMDNVGVCVLWDNFIGRTCVISIVIQDRHAFTKSVIRECFRYPFQIAELSCVMALVDSKNVESVELCERVGFKQAGQLPNSGVEGDLIIYTMFKDDCRWISQEH